MRTKIPDDNLLERLTAAASEHAVGDFDLTAAVGDLQLMVKLLWKRLTVIQRVQVVTDMIGPQGAFREIPEYEDLAAEYAYLWGG